MIANCDTCGCTFDALCGWYTECRKCFLRRIYPPEEGDDEDTDVYEGDDPDLYIPD